MVIVEFRVFDRLFVLFYPATGGTIATFHVVADDLGAAIADRRAPFDLDVVLVGIHAFRLAGLSRSHWIIGY